MNRNMKKLLTASKYGREKYRRLRREKIAVYQRGKKRLNPA